MKINFNDLPWHDAILRHINISREKPGEQDVIQILIDWPDNNTSTIEFSDCYSFVANMNFGIVASESILTAECIEKSAELMSICNEWANVDVDLKELKCYKITTNSTASVLNIFALNFRVLASN